MSRGFAAFLLALATVSLTAQTPQPTFRTGANYVRVDMYATRDGQPVEDLKATEVEILEDGVLQKIDAFEHVRVRTSTPIETRIEPNTIEQSRQMAGNPRARVFVIFLDTYHTQVEGSATMRQPLINFIDRVLGPDDMVALMTPEMSATDITLARKTTVISNLLQREWLWGQRGRLVQQDEKDQLYEACYPPGMPGAQGVAAEMIARRHEKMTLDALEDLMIHLAGLREERKAILAVSEGWRLYTKNDNLARKIDDAQVRPGDVLRRPPGGQPSDRGQMVGSPRVECESDRVALATLDHELRLRELTQDANRSNVTFYPVYARGLVAFDSPIGPDPPPTLQQDAANLRARQNSLRFLADDTDGVAIINTNNIDGMLRRIVDDLSSYYLMGYYATNTKTDGRFRTISVRVKRDGVRVRARKGYRGLTSSELSRGVTTPSSGSATDPNAASADITPVVTFNPRAQFRIRAASWSRSPSGGSAGALLVVGELDPQARKLPAWIRGAQADIAVVDSTGKPVASQRIDLKPTESAFTVQLPESGGVSAGDFTVRVRLRSPIEGELGLTDTAHVSLKDDASLGEAVILRRGLTTGPQHVRTADPRFQRTDRIRLELASTSAEPVTARLFDRNGKALTVPVEIAERPDPAATFKWIVIDVALAPLAAGDYAVEVAQGQTKQVTSFRVIP